MNSRRANDSFEGQESTRSRLRTYDGSGSTSAVGERALRRPRRRAQERFDDAATRVSLAWAPGDWSGVRPNPSGGQVSDGDLSLEVRWIVPGSIAPGMLEWWGPFTARIEERSDSYLVGPTGAEVGVKVRGGTQLDVKVYAGSPGVLTVPGRAEGPLQWWRKWSYPLAGDGKEAVPHGWANVRKVRRILFFSAEGRSIPVGDGGCAVELTEVMLERRRWWTLGFEATGAAALSADGLHASAVRVFARPLPGQLRLGPDRSASYSEWLEAAREMTMTGG